MTCTVPIPIYTTELSDDEFLSLRQTHRVLGRHRIVYVTPHGLDLRTLAARLGLDTVRQSTFGREYFASVRGYNRLMTSKDFYRAFGTDYILICQTDAWVFTDELESWCEKGYDYIGAPWLGSERQLGSLYRPVLCLRRAWARLTGLGYGARCKWRVGNGGLSLRRVQTFANLCTEHARTIEKLEFRRIADNEDVFWCVRMRKHLKTPEWGEAMRFAVEFRPEWALRCLHRLPFGCHGWNKQPYSAFWRPVIEEYISANPF